MKTIDKYWKMIGELAAIIQSDRCTGVPDFYLQCCLEHDVHYRLGFSPRTRQTITRAEADAAFRKCIQRRSKFGRFSPMSWWRWVAVRILGREIWEKYRAKPLDPIILAIVYDVMDSYFPRIRKIDAVQ